MCACHRCTACGHKGSIPVSEIRKAVATTVRARRMTGCGLRRRWVVVRISPCFVRRIDQLPAAVTTTTPCMHLSSRQHRALPRMHHACHYWAASTYEVWARSYPVPMQVGVKQIACPGAGCNARFCPRCGGAEHTGTLCSPDTQVRCPIPCRGTWAASGLLRMPLACNANSTALQLHPNSAGHCNCDQCIPPQLRSQCTEHRASA